MPVCGGSGPKIWEPDHNKCEVLDINKNQWKNVSPYPFVQGLI